MDATVPELLEHEDLDAWDLTENRSGRPEKLGVLLYHCKCYIDAQVDTAVDDCRHDGIHKGDVITQFSERFNVRDLHEQIVKSCPLDTPIPSVQWLRL